MLTQRKIAINLNSWLDAMQYQRYSNTNLSDNIQSNSDGLKNKIEGINNSTSTMVIKIIDNKK